MNVLSSQHVVCARGIAHPWLCDHMGHLNTRHIMGFLDDAAQHLFSLLGLRQSEQLGLADVRHEIQYLSEVPVGRLVHVDCGVVDIGRSSLTYTQRLFVTDTMTQCVDCLAKTVLFDRVRRKSAPLPDDVRLAAERVRVAEYRQDRA
jgi:acyl-CoA thioester hydrolase